MISQNKRRRKNDDNIFISCVMRVRYCCDRRIIIQIIQMKIIIRVENEEWDDDDDENINIY